MLKCLCSNEKGRVPTPAIKGLLQSFITIITKRTECVSRVQFRIQGKCVQAVRHEETILWREISS